jgi:hypothetical protein
MLPKILGNKEGHGAPPGYYTLLFWVTFWPGAALAAMAVPSIWAARRERGARFLLAWIIPSWILFELVVTKLPHYVLPVYPAIAILIAGVVDSQMLAQQRRHRLPDIEPDLARPRHAHRSGFPIETAKLGHGLSSDRYTEIETARPTE